MELENLLIIKLIISEYRINPEFKPNDDFAPLSDFMITKKMKNFDLPDKDQSEERENFCKELFEKTCEDFAKLIGCDEKNPDLDIIFDYLKYFFDILGNDEQGKYFEKDAITFLKETISKNNGDGIAVVEGLKEIVKLHEIGGDLDTIGSNTLYGYWALNEIFNKTEQQPVYGKDFEFDFINYHEGFSHLNLRHQNCDIYLPDFPIDAIPDLKGDVDALLECNNRMISFDDHHPYSLKSKADLEELLNSKKIDNFTMSGCLEGKEEIPKENQKCGTDLIYESRIKDTELDSEVWKELTRLAHVQDLHIIEDKMAIDLSKLIGSKYSKLDMVQQLMLMNNIDDLKNILQTTGWDSKIKEYENALEELCPKLEKGMGIIEFTIPLSENNKDKFMQKLSNGKKNIIKLFKTISFGAIDLTNYFYNSQNQNTHKILLLLAPFQSAKEAKINVASAINYFKEKFEFDYIFYCYGLSLMTTRKVNGDDEALDLNILATKIGSKDDGGHAEAATCKPSSNPNFPSDKLTKINNSNFDIYIKYLAVRLEKEFGFTIVKSEKLKPNFYKSILE
jgi:hypothetical protein